jgi:hypothetical protein
MLSNESHLLPTTTSELTGAALKAWRDLIAFE